MEACIYFAADVVNPRNSSLTLLIHLMNYCDACLCLVPGPPSSVYFPVVTQSTAHIVWNVPSQPNGIITGYRVSYGIRSDRLTFAVTVDSLDSSQRDYFATSLDAYKYYIFDLAAKTQFGWGEAVQVLVYTMTNRSMLIH